MGVEPWVFLVERHSAVDVTAVGPFLAPKLPLVVDAIFFSPLSILPLPSPVLPFPVLLPPVFPVLGWEEES